MNNEPTEYVADQARRSWAASHRGGLIQHFFQLIGAGKLPEAIYIAEYPAADWQSAHCTGDPIGIWSFRGATFEPVSDLPALDYSNPIASRTPVIRYCVDNDRKRMILCKWYGLRAGHGSLYHWDGVQWKSRSPSWKS
jgi:hypothetical protein